MRGLVWRYRPCHDGGFLTVHWGLTPVTFLVDESGLFSVFGESAPSEEIRPTSDLPKSAMNRPRSEERLCGRDAGIGAMSIGVEEQRKNRKTA
jgi:hypothetical protein